MNENIFLNDFFVKSYNFRSTFWFDLFTKKSFILSDTIQKAELIDEIEKALPKFRNGYSYEFELSNGRNYLDAGSYLRFSRDRRRENPKIIVKLTGTQAIGDKQISNAIVL